MTADGNPARGGARPDLVIGTRASPLARAQAGLVRAALEAAHPGIAVGVETIRTTGDRFTDRPLSAIGGKGLFTKEIEEALLAGTVDIAVHSMKDVATVLPEGLAIPCLLPREDPRDVLLARDPAAATIARLPQGARIGTASLRRAAQVLSLRPDCTVVTFRGNVQTRMRKLADGEADATFLALAGLKRMDMEHAATAILDPDEMLPAVGQGAIGIECRDGDTRVRGLLAPLDHEETRIRVAAERALLATLDGSCRTPIGGLAEIADGRLSLRAMIAMPDGSARFDAAVSGKVADAERIGVAAGERLRAEAGPELFAATGLPDGTG